MATNPKNTCALKVKSDQKLSAIYFRLSMPALSD